MNDDSEGVRAKARRDRDAANERRRWIIDLPSGRQRILTWSEIPTERRSAPFVYVWELARSLGSESAYELSL